MCFTTVEEKKQCFCLQGSSGADDLPTFSFIRTFGQLHKRPEYKFALYSPRKQNFALSKHFSPDFSLPHVSGGATIFGKTDGK